MGRKMAPYHPPVERMVNDTDWIKMKTLAHFILWARLDHIPNGTPNWVTVAITERGTDLGVVVYQRRNLPYTGYIDHEEYDEAIRVLHKFERLWPCSFLAKEFPRGKYGLHT